MDSFESLVSSLLRREGYWTETGFKVELTKQDKHRIGRPSLPLWEIDVVAYKGKGNRKWPDRFILSLCAIADESILFGSMEYRMTARVYAVVINFLVLTCAALAFAQEDFNAIFAEATEHFEKFENREAAGLFARVHARRPDDFDALEMVIRAHHDLGLDLAADDDKDGAKRSFTKAVEYARKMKSKFPNRAQTFFYLAATNGSLARFEGGKDKVDIARNVERYCQRAIELDASYALAYAVLGVFYREVANLNVFQRAFASLFFGNVPEGSKEDAIRFLEHAVKLDPELNFAQFELAVTYHSLRDSRAASEHLRRVIHLRAQTSQDVRNQATARRMLQQLNE